MMASTVTRTELNRHGEHDGGSATTILKTAGRLGAKSVDDAELNGCCLNAARAPTGAIQMGRMGGWRMDSVSNDGGASRDVIYLTCLDLTCALPRLGCSSLCQWQAQIPQIIVGSRSFIVSAVLLAEPAFVACEWLRPAVPHACTGHPAHFGGTAENKTRTFFLNSVFSFLHSSFLHSFAFCDNARRQPCWPSLPRLARRRF
jgi:hypothetical protein